MKDKFPVYYGPYRDDTCLVGWAATLTAAERIAKRMLTPVDRHYGFNAVVFESDPEFSGRKYFVVNKVR